MNIKMHFLTSLFILRELQILSKLFKKKKLRELLI